MREIWFSLRTLRSSHCPSNVLQASGLAHEATESGLLSPELAAGISRVKGVKQLGFPSGIG